MFIQFLKNSYLTLLPNTESEFHAKYHLTNLKSHHLYTDKFDINVLQLNHTDLAKNHPDIKEVGNLIFELNYDNQAKELLEGQRRYREHVLVLHGHVSPPIPRRHADALRDLVDAVDRAASVAARNDQVPVDDINDERLPLTFNGFDVPLLLFDKTIYQSALTDGSHDDRGFIIHHFSFII